MSYVSFVRKKAGARGWIGTALLAVVLGACAGTERSIFDSVSSASSQEVPPVIAPPAGMGGGGADAGVRHPTGPIRLPDDEDGGARGDLGLDPNAEFDWLETLPGDGPGTCNPGRYVGAFECTMPGSFTGAPQEIAGEIAFTLQGSAELQELQIAEGSIDGFFFTAPTMTGQLDCRTAAFDAYSTGNAVVFSSGAFSANLSGLYDPQVLGIEGSFRMVNEQDEHCDGTFTVRIAP